MRTRLFLLSHARTSRGGAPGFPGDDALGEPGRAATLRLARRLPRFGRLLASPARAARDTAALLAGEAAIEPALRDQDFGGWIGRPLAEVEAAEPEALAGWIAGLEPPGGESFAAVIARVGAWLDAALGAGDRALAVTHPAVVRAAVIHVLGAPADAARALDVAPLHLAEFASDGRRWTLRGLAPADDA